MNKIDELANQCWENIDGNSWEFDYHKFAKLIVQECVDVLEEADRVKFEEYQEQFEIGFAGIPAVVDLLKKNFNLKD